MSETRESAVLKHLLWIDCIGAAVVGATVILLSGWLSDLEGLPRAVIVGTGGVNLLYGCYSFSLAIRPERPMHLIRGLVVANLAWAPVCVGLVIAFSSSITPFGVAHLLGEAAYVGGLAVLEWRHRDLLRTAAPGAVPPSAPGTAR